MSKPVNKIITQKERPGPPPRKASRKPPKAVRSFMLQVLERDEFGRPTSTRLWHDDEAIDLKGGEEFIVAYVDPAMCAPQTPKAQA